VFGCFAANGLYLAGPAVDGYLTWFGLRHRAVTVLLFLAGTVLASLLAIACVAFSFSPF